MSRQEQIHPRESKPTEVVVQGGGEGLVQDVRIGGHRLASDEPLAAGGSDLGPDPYDLLLAALGSCTSMTIGMYARRKQWPLESVRVTLRHQRIHAEDCADCDTKLGMLDRIERDIELQGALDDEQRASLLDVANRCPVHRTLTSEIAIETKLVPIGGENAGRS